MLHIAICDDEETTVKSNALITQECLNESGFAGEIHTYTKSDNLLYDITEDRFFYDLISRCRVPPAWSLQPPSSLSFPM